MTTADLSDTQAAKVVDARGSACPGPLLEAKKGIGAIKVDEVLEIFGDLRPVGQHHPLDSTVDCLTESQCRAEHTGRLSGIQEALSFAQRLFEANRGIQGQFN